MNVKRSRLVFTGTLAQLEAQREAGILEDDPPRRAPRRSSARPAGSRLYMTQWKLRSDPAYPYQSQRQVLWAVDADEACREVIDRIYQRGGGSIARQDLQARAVVYDTDHDLWQTW